IVWLLTVLAFIDLTWEWFWPLLASALTGRAVAQSSARASELRAALLLPELDKEWTGALVEGLAHTNGHVRSISRLRLTTILPTLTYADAEALSPGRHDILFGQLTPTNAFRHPDLLIAILQFGATGAAEQALEGADYLAGTRAISPSQRR